MVRIHLHPFGNKISTKLHIFSKYVYNELNNVAGWSSLEARRAHNPKVVGSNPAPAISFAQIAQLVEQRTENPCVAGSIPALGICSANEDKQFNKIWSISSVGRALDF